jgi:hypothetical protein
MMNLSGLKKLTGSCCRRSGSGKLSASENTSFGDVALAFNDFSGSGFATNNMAVGGAAMFNNVDGSEKRAVDTGAGPNLVAGFNNTYVGDFVGSLAPDERSTTRIGDLSNGNGSGSLACLHRWYLQ